MNKNRIETFFFQQFVQSMRNNPTVKNKTK